MYLKNIEVQGFKAFANKIVFDFHNGITGIVGPNGSGKSNVADAVRWVLGEQSAKQLRGSSMQDVIFAGTENRKPLSYAYVAITLDNTDRQLPIDYKEVTIARRVYRSGESEYLLNGNACRLKDVNELFYDTGIGKEGYSIIGQGQIDKILSGKPEERRELFDEAAGIVKYKRRKATTQKKLESERENLVRISDILSELERQVGPLERQAEVAKRYLKKKEELKIYDVNAYLLDMAQSEERMAAIEEKSVIASDELSDMEQAKKKNMELYADIQEKIKAMDEAIANINEEMNQTGLTKGKLEGQINVLKEQIHSAQMSDEHYSKRMQVIDEEAAEKQEQQKQYEIEKEELDKELAIVVEKSKTLSERLKATQDAIRSCNEGIESGKQEVLDILTKISNIKSAKQRFKTMQEQIQIQQAQLNQRRLTRKSEEAELDAALKTAEEELKIITDENATLAEDITNLESQVKEWAQKYHDTRQKLEQDNLSYHKKQTRLESLQNIAERYEGYGNSTKKIMERKADTPGIHGVVADLMKVEKRYETAIETALGGNIQNIVTEDEATAKEMIAYLKENRLGRATFLPLTSVTGKQQTKYDQVLGKKGVLGMANELVQTDSRYDGIMSYLLGRVVVAEHIDSALALAKEFKYSLHIVTLEGEYLSPGGSMAGGAFKNNSNLLGRNREIAELEKELKELKQSMEEAKNRLADVETARELAKADVEEAKEKLQSGYLKANTAKMHYDRAKEQKEESRRIFEGLQSQAKEIENQMNEIEKDAAETENQLAEAEKRKAEIEEETVRLQNKKDEQTYLEEGQTKEYSAIQIEESAHQQKCQFIDENLNRILAELKKLEDEKFSLVAGIEESKQDVERKTAEIEAIKATIIAGDQTHVDLETKLREANQKKEELTAENKEFFQKSEEINGKINGLEKELYRLEDQRQKLVESREYQNTYMWEEYELTYHNAMSIRDEQYKELSALKKLIQETKDEIRKMGNVNVNAIEDYKEISERYEFLKTQHDDLVEAEATLVGIIEELDAGMRAQFTEKFADIQREFDKAFKELFGGGKGTLELTPDEDILECGIRIIAQPPGKKLQNMMQLSGGEKSLTAIALLFAIQNLKPSPFCLLDEIEAALDDSNVERFAKYLHKLTKNTQFIIITHRRGTMNAADRLYGITMQEKGVSTLVSVNLIENDLS